VLIGTPVVPIPAHPRIRHLGFVSDSEKFDAIAGSAALVMPSYFESLSMVALEAWALGRPVIANARCDVLVGQCLRSGAGLYYQNAAEFGAVLDRVLDDAALAAELGRRGQRYYQQHYSWPVIEQKYLDMFSHLSSTTPSSALEPLPGWLTRRRRDKPAGAAVVRGLPSGPVRPATESRL
jgi:glycosyltransferase involved in cell wall biosynthesis